jgi:putative SOS response-associated peptidase YedK
VCYSNSSTSENIELAQKYRKQIPQNLPNVKYHHASGFTFPEWPVINNSYHIQIMNWGLVPSWFRGQKIEIASKTLNCRSESVESKVSFKNLIHSNRCVIPSSGFFEWQQIGSIKAPHFIYSPNSEILSMAGLWDININTETGEIYQSFTILTTEANEFMSQIHNTKKRMPVLLPDSEIQNWLEGRLNWEDTVKISIDIALTSHIVDKKIILSSNSNCPEVQKPFNRLDSQLSFF